MYSKMTCISSFLKWDKDSLYHNIGRSWVLYSIANSLAKVLKCLCLEQQQCIQFAKSFQSCPTLCDPIDGSQPGSPVPGILQARTLEWVAISFSKTWKGKVKVKSLSKCLTLRDPMDCSLPGSSIHGIFQARELEWGAIAFSVCPLQHYLNSQHMKTSVNQHMKG